MPISARHYQHTDPHPNPRRSEQQCVEIKRNTKKSPTANLRYTRRDAVHIRTAHMYEQQHSKSKNNACLSKKISRSHTRCCFICFIEQAHSHFARIWAASHIEHHMGWWGGVVVRLGTKCTRIACNVVFCTGSKMHKSNAGRKHAKSSCKAHTLWVALHCVLYST